MESPKTQKINDLFLDQILFAVLAVGALWWLVQYFDLADEMEKPYLIQVDFNGDSSWDASFLADRYVLEGNHLIMHFGNERYRIDYSSFLATKLDIARNDHEPGPLSDGQAEKLLKLSKDEEGAKW